MKSVLNLIDAPIAIGDVYIIWCKSIRYKVAHIGPSAFLTVNKGGLRVFGFDSFSNLPLYKYIEHELVTDEELKEALSYAYSTLSRSVLVELGLA